MTDIRVSDEVVIPNDFIRRPYLLANMLEDTLVKRGMSKFAAQIVTCELSRQAEDDVDRIIRGRTLSQYKDVPVTGMEVVLWLAYVCHCVYLKTQWLSDKDVIKVMALTAATETILNEGEDQ